MLHFIKVLKVIPALFMIAHSFPVIGQNQWHVKLYQNIDYIKMIRNTWSNDERKYIRSEKFESNFNRTSVAIGLISPEKWRHEAELSFSSNGVVPVSMEQKHRSSDFDETRKFYYVQYEAIRSISNTGKVNFFVGLGIQSYWTKLESEPLTTNVYYAHQCHIGGTININPHLVYQPFKKIIIDFGFKFGLFDIRQFEFYVANPAIPLRQQTAHETQTDFFPKAYTIRLGIGYQIR